MTFSPTTQLGSFAAAMLLGLGAACADSGPPDSSANGELILFQRELTWEVIPLPEGGLQGVREWDLFAVPPDGSQPTRLTETRANEITPAWAPDGQAFAFAADYAGNFDIYVMRNGQHVQLTSAAANETAPVWSPDGAQIVFLSDQDGAVSNYGPPGVRRTDLYVMQIDGTGATPLTLTPDLSEGAPAWAPDGSRLVFARDSGVTRFESALYVIPAEGGTPSLLPTPPAPNPIEPAWSPDGRRIAFSCRCVVGPQTDDNSLWTIGIDDGLVTRVRSGLARRPSWSADGTRVAFAFGVDDWFGRFNIAQLASTLNDGSGFIELTQLAPSDAWFDIIGSPEAWRSSGQ